MAAVGSILASAVAVLVALLLVIQVAWRVFRKYLPSRSLCALVHRNLPAWTTRAVGLLALPDKISTIGFVSSLVWACTVALNMVLLAQVLGMIFDGGTRVVIRGFGTFGTVALLAAVLFSISQSLFGLASERAKSWTARGAFVVLLVATIVVEAGLAYYRATLLIGGEERVSGTLVDHVMVTMGPWLVAAIGVFIPAAHTAAGFVGFSGFIEPVIGFAARGVVGALSFLLCGLAYAYLGFHDEPPTALPRWAEDLREECDAVLDRAKRLKAAAATVRNQQHAMEKTEGVLRATPSVGDLAARVKDLVDKNTEREAGWTAKSREFHVRAGATAALNGLTCLASDIDKFCRAIGTEARLVINAVRSLSADVDRAAKRPALAADAEQTRHQLAELVPQIRADQESLSERVQAIETKQREIRAIWAGATPTSTVLAAIEAEIREVKALPASLPSDSPLLPEAKAVFARCHSLVANTLAEPAVEGHSAEGHAARALADVEKALSEPAPAAEPASPHTIPDLQRQLAEVDAIIEIAESNQRELERLRKRIQARCREIDRRPFWLWWLKDLVGVKSETQLPSVFFAAVAGAAMLVAGACSEGPGGQPPERPRFVALVLDETGSFAGVWPDMLKSAALVARRLGPSAGMVVVGLDDQGFQPDDVRLPVTLFSDNALTAKVQGDALAKAISALTPRAQKRPLTDVVGAMAHAAYFLGRQPDHEPWLVVFSDLRQTPKAPRPADMVNMSFPPGTNLQCFYVDAADRNDWRQSLALWTTLLDPLGVTMTESNFHQSGETVTDLNKLFPKPI